MFWEHTSNVLKSFQRERCLRSEECNMVSSPLLIIPVGQFAWDSPEVQEASCSRVAGGFSLGSGSSMRDGRGEGVRQDEFSEIEVERGPAVGHDHADELRLLPASGAPEHSEPAACMCGLEGAWNPQASRLGRVTVLHTRPVHRLGSNTLWPLRVASAMRAKKASRCRRSLATS